MRIYGITGGSGSGKTTALKAAEALGALILDCDAIYHTLLHENPAMVNAIGERFPGTVEHGVLNRQKLAKLVFAEPCALADLNAITHPYVVEAVNLAIRHSQAPFGVIDAIGLLESDLLGLCRATVAVTAPLERRLARLMKRDGISMEAARDRIFAQPPDEYYVNKCDCHLDNCFASSEEFRTAAAALWQQLERSLHP